MFTGIIQEVGVFQKKKIQGDSFQLIIQAQNITSKLTRGESVAVNGTCLTVTEFGRDFFQADVMPETVKNTNLKDLKAGARVNLELPVTTDSFFGGHFLTGHIDGPGRVVSIKEQANAHLLEIEVGRELEQYIVKKGSIAINGVSLTVVDVTDSSFTVSLIPESWQQTNLRFLKPDSEINIETDLIGKYVVKMLRNRAKINEKETTIDKNFLQANGFL